MNSVVQYLYSYLKKNPKNEGAWFKLITETNQVT